MAVLDTHAIARSLTDAGIKSEHADAIVDAVRQAAGAPADMATKADLAELEARLTWRVRRRYARADRRDPRRRHRCRHCHPAHARLTPPPADPASASVVLGPRETAACTPGACVRRISLKPPKRSCTAIAGRRVLMSGPGRDRSTWGRGRTATAVIGGRHAAVGAPAPPRSVRRCP